MSQSVIDICNSALQRVGAASILSLSDNSPEARACALAYDANRRDELRRYRWNFAITRAVLAPDETPPAFGFLYAFTLPSDCLRVLRDQTPNSDWVVEGRKILTNDGNTLCLRYIRDVEDVSQFDPVCYSAISIALAVDICEKLTQSNSKKQALLRDYADCIQHARKIDSFEKGPIEPVADDWLLARL